MCFLKHSIIIICLVVCGEAITAQPTFLFPADGPEQVDLPTSFNIRVSKITGFSVFYDVEISKDISFASSQGAPDYQGTVSSRRRNLPVKNLRNGERYYIRTRSWSRVTGFSPYRLDSVTIATDPYLTYIDNITSGSYLQDPDNTFQTLDKSGASRYDWEFNTQSDFSGRARSPQV